MINADPIAQFDIPPLDRSIEPALRREIDAKTKPPGALGELEALALKVALVQGTPKPEVLAPTVVVFAADHGITDHGVTEDRVSAYPGEVTRQMVLNFLAGGAAINVFARCSGLALKVVDAGVRGARIDDPRLLDRRVAGGTRNFARERAMTDAECARAIHGATALVDEIHATGCNVIGFGEMGIGNTAAASMVMAIACDLPLADCVGAGAGLDAAGIERKRAVLDRAMRRIIAAGDPPTGFDLLCECGGFEMVMIAAGMLRAAQRRMLVLVDGFIATAALLAVRAQAPGVEHYCVFCHRSAERGHRLMLERFDARPLLALDMRLGEGTGAALAVPLIEAATGFLREMATFEDAGVSGRDG